MPAIQIISNGEPYAQKIKMPKYNNRSIEKYQNEVLNKTNKQLKSNFKAVEEKRNYLFSDLETLKNRPKVVIVDDFVDFNFSKELPTFKETKKINEESLQHRKKKSMSNEFKCGLISDRSYNIEKNYNNVYKIKAKINKQSLTKKIRSKEVIEELKSIQKKNGKSNLKRQEINEEHKNKKHQTNLSAEMHERKQEKKQTLIEKKFGFTMPLTEKLNSLLSLNSEMVESKVKLFHRINSYDIPTEHSFEEINEIREFEKRIFRKKIIPEFEQILYEKNEPEGESHQDESTKKIINSYVKMLQENRSEIYKEELNKEEILSEIVIEPIITETLEIKSPKFVLKKSKELEKLHEFVEFVQLAEQNLVNTDLIVNQISLFLKNKEQEDSNLEVLKEASVIAFQDLKEQLSKRLMMIEQRKINEFLSLEARKDKFTTVEYQKEKENIEKWTECQKKEINEAEEQLKNGMSIFKNIAFKKDIYIKKIKKSASAREIVPENKLKIKNNKCFKKVVQTEHESDSHKKEKPFCYEKNFDKKHLNQLKNIKLNEKEQQELNYNEIKNEEINIFFEEDGERIKKIDYVEDPLSEFEEDLRLTNCGLISNSFKFSESSFLPTSPQILLDSPFNQIEFDSIEKELEEENKQYTANFSLEENDKNKEFNLSSALKPVDYFELSSLTLEEKRDIFEFIFLDLCIEISEEYKPESTIMKQINKFCEIVSKKRKGFQTDINYVKGYLLKLITFLQNNEEEFAKYCVNVDKSLGPSTLDILKYLHEEEENESEENPDSSYILDIKLFENFEKVYLDEVQIKDYYLDEEKEARRKHFLKSSIHIHNKAIFDALNENLDKERPFGLWGQPFAWKAEPKVSRKRTVLEKEEILTKNAQKTLESVEYLCGILLDKEDSKLKGNPNVTEALIEHIRAERVSKMLAQDLFENEEKMLFIDDEETEILVDVGKKIFLKLVEELIEEAYL